MDATGRGDVVVYATGRGDVVVYAVAMWWFMPLFCWLDLGFVVSDLTLSSFGVFGETSCPRSTLMYDSRRVTETTKCQPTDGPGEPRTHGTRLPLMSSGNYIMEENCYNGRDKNPIMDHMMRCRQSHDRILAHAAAWLSSKRY